MTGPAELTGVLQRGLQVAATECARDASLFHLGFANVRYPEIRALSTDDRSWPGAAVPS